MTPVWKVLIVDDAPEVRTMTRLALENFEYQGIPLELLEAGSADQARQLLSKTDDIAVAFLDVVMETEHAGLDLVHWIRKVQHNPLIRLLVRTGQPGLFPASTVLVDYDINDYWEKTELTFSRLHGALTTGLRGYSDLLRMHRRTLQLRLWADRFPDLLGVRDWSSLLRLVMLRLKELFPDLEVSALVCRNDGAKWPLLAGIGCYAPSAPDILESLTEGRARVLVNAWDQKGLAENDDALALYFDVPAGPGHVFLLDTGPAWAPYERNVGRLVLQNFRAALENRILIHDLERRDAELSQSVHQQEGLVRRWHHRFHGTLQSLITSLELESRERSSVSGRSPAQGAARRLAALSLLHSLLAEDEHVATLDLHAYLKVWLPTLSTTWELWGVPCPVPAEQAGSLVLAFVEAADLIVAPRWNRRMPRQVRVTDSPRQISFGALPDDVDVEVLKASLEWSILGSFAAQGQGTIDVSPEGLTLRLSD